MNVYSGVWRDIAVRKRKTEVDGQLGVLVRKGESLGVAMPLTSATDVFAGGALGYSISRFTVLRE